MAADAAASSAEFMPFPRRAKVEGSGAGEARVGEREAVDQQSKEGAVEIVAAGFRRSFQFGGANDQKLQLLRGHHVGPALAVGFAQVGHFANAFAGPKNGNGASLAA